MAFWNRREKRSSSGLQFPSDWLTDTMVGTTSTAGPRVNVTNALGLVWPAVSLISEQIGQLPLKVYRDLGDGEREEARSHRSWRMLHDRPNALTPAGRFWSTVAVHLLLYGNAYIEKTRDEAGSVDELWVLPPGEVTVKWWPRIKQKTFVHRPANTANVVSSQRRGQQERELDEGDVLHIMNLSLDGLVGMSPIEACRQQLGTALARDEFEAEFYKNGATLSGLVQMKGTIKNDQALQRFSATLKALFTGPGRRHGVPVLEDGAEWKETGSPLKDLEFVASKNLSRTDIAVMYHLPPNKVGGSTGDGLVYSTVEMNQTAIAIDAVAPLAKTITDAVSQDPSIMPQNIHQAEFTLEGLMRADAAGRSEFYERMHNIVDGDGTRAMDVEEIRRRENMGRAKKPPKPPAAPIPPPEQLQLDDTTDTTAPNGVNGNGNGAMPAIKRS